MRWAGRAATRRSFLCGLGSAAATLACGPGRLELPVDPKTRALTATVERVLVPDVRALADRSRALAGALRVLQRDRAPARLREAQRAWTEACLAWERGQAFKQGPLVSTGALMRATFWPVRQHAIAQLLDGPDALDTERIAGLGVDQKGLFTLEQLLFTSSSEVTLSNGEPNARAAQLAVALADDVLAHAERALAALGDGRAWGEEFARGGQLSVSRLVNQVLATVETAAMRVARVLQLHDEHRLHAADVQASASGLSTALLVEWLSVSARIYGDAAEPGLAALTRAAAPAIHASVQRALETAARALRGLSEPLERAVLVERAQLTQVLHALKQLEVSVRAEWVSALGVTLTFTSSDGD